jgi:tetratricopeptide (TPR) repeat protein
MRKAFAFVSLAAWFVACAGNPAESPDVSDATRKAPATRLADLPPCASPGRISHDSLRAMLRQGRFAELDAYFEARQAAFERDPACEQDVWSPFLTFWDEDAWVGQAAGRWVEASPDSFAAYTIQGIHWSSVGQRRRGRSWAKDVTDEQWAGMYQAYEVAVGAFRDAIRLRPKNLVAWAELIDVAKVGGRTGDHEAIFSKAIGVVPESFRVWAIEVDALQPRWGGSYLRMQALAHRAQQYADVNPKMHWLLGYADADRASVAATQEDYEQSVEFLEAAMRHGDHTVWYERLANVARRAGQYEKSVRAAEVAIERGSYGKWSLVSRGRSLRALGENERSVEAMRLLVEHFPDWKWSHFELGLSLRPLERWNEMEVAWRRAVELDPDWYQAVQSLCTLLIYPLDRPADALPLARWMVETQPQSPPVWFWYADALYRARPQDPRVPELFRHYLALYDPADEFVSGASERANEVLGLLGQSPAKRAP